MTPFYVGLLIGGFIGFLLAAAILGCLMASREPRLMEIDPQKALEKMRELQT